MTLMLQIAGGILIAIFALAMLWIISEGFEVAFGGIGSGIALLLLGGLVGIVLALLGY
jgi:hypothetical protein